MSKENNCPLIEGECIKGNQKDERIKQLEEGLNDVRAWLTRTCTDDPRHPFYIYREVCDKALGELQ